MADRPHHHTDLLILQPTPFCNIDCKYCYLPDRTARGRMNDDVIAAASTMLVEGGQIGDRLSVVWHAGEPLVLPPNYYDNAMGIVRSHIPDSCAVTHYFQTNATLIDDAWCDLFRREDVSVGVSMDGPKRLHDLNRVTRAGRGTYETVMRGMARLKDRGIDFHVISVLSKQALFFPDEIHDFFDSNDVREVCFNVEEIEGDNETSTLNSPEVEQLFAAFMERFLDLVANGAESMRVREFSNAFGALFDSDRAGAINSQALPLAIVSVAVNGDFSTYSPELLGVKHPRFGDFTLGNVTRDRLADVLGSAKFKAIGDEIADGVNRCRGECGFFSVCGGGAPANKIFETGSFCATETMFCRLTVKSVFEIVLNACESGLDIEKPSATYPTL